MTVIPKIAWGFNISANRAYPIDKALESGYSDGFVFSPLPFKVHFEVRSPRHEAVIIREFEDAKAFFAQYES